MYRATYVFLVLLINLGYCKAENSSSQKEVCDTSEVNQLIKNTKDLIAHFKMDSALSLVETAIDRSVGCQNQSFHAQAIILKGVIFFYTFKYDDSSIFLTKGREISKEINYLKGVADATYWQGFIYSVKADYHESLKWIGNALEIYQELEVPIKIADCYTCFAYIYEKLGEPEKSPLEYQKALDIYIEEVDSARIADGYNNLGHSYYYLGDYGRAMDHYFTALSVWSAMNDSINIAQAYGSLGTICLPQKNYSEALDYYFKQEEILVKYNNLYELAKTKQNIGVTYNYLKEYGKAKQYYKKAIDLFEMMNYKSGLANSYKNLAGSYVNTNDYDSAIVYVEKAMEYSVEINSQKYIANNHIQKGQIYFNQHKYGLAQNSFSKALELSGIIHDLETEKIASKYLSQIFEIKGMYKKALDLKARHYELVDSLNSRENLKKLTQLELSYEFDKEKQEIELEQAKQTAILQGDIEQERLIRKFLIVAAVLLVVIITITVISLLNKKKSNKVLSEKNEEIAHKNEQLAQALVEKESLLKEIHHRVKNNLQIVSSLLNIQTEYSTDSKIIGAVHESQSRVKAMALIHQLLYQEESFTRINFENYLKQLSKTLEGIFKKEQSKIITEIHAEEIALDIDTSIPLGLIVTELVSNAYKYAFNDSKQGNIMVRLSDKGKKQYELIVSDDGPGLPEDFNLDESKSMGLKLVKLLSEQMDGELSFENKKGAQFNLVFSENE